MKLLLWVNQRFTYISIASVCLSVCLFVRTFFASRVRRCLYTYSFETYTHCALNLDAGLKEVIYQLDNYVNTARFSVKLSPFNAHKFCI
jgi:hypothetical protein